MIPLRRPLLLIGTYYCVTSLSQRPQQSKFQQSTKSTTKQPAKQWTGKRRKREKRTNGPTYPPIRRTFSKVSDAAADHRTWKPLSMSRSHWIALVLILTKVWYVKCLIDNQVVAQAFLEQMRIATSTMAIKGCNSNYHSLDGKIFTRSLGESQELIKPHQELRDEPPSGISVGSP